VIAARAAAASRLPTRSSSTAAARRGAAFPYVISLTELAGTNPHHAPPSMFNQMKEEDAMKTIEKLAPWITVVEQGLEVALFAAASVVVASGLFVLLLRPTIVLA